MRFAAFCMLAVAIAADVPAADLNDPPPRASLITVPDPDPDRRIEIHGSEGSVPASSTVIALNLDTGHLTHTLAGEGGAFTLPRLFAPAGTSVLLKVDPAGRPVLSSAPPLIPYAGTIVRVPEPAAPSGRIPFHGAAFTSGGLPTVWRFEGSLLHQPEQRLRVEGNVIIASPSIDGAATVTARPQLLLERLSYADGQSVQAQATFSSTFLTPTGLPIERLPWRSFGGRSGDRVTLQTSMGRAEGMVIAEVDLTQGGLGLQPGYYRTALNVEFEGARFPNEEPAGQFHDLKAIDRASRKPMKEIGLQTLYGPIVRIGTPDAPRIPWMLLANNVYEGTRGIRAVEDRESFGFSPRVATQSDVFIVPRTDQGGAPIRYNIEPFTPSVSIGDREVPSPPLIPFHFPSGELRASVTDPSGRVTSIGPAPFVQSRSHNATENELALETGGGYPHDPYQLSTMNPAFELIFERDGLHIIRLEGWIEDIWGHRWEGGGTYEVLVARPMTLDTSVLPGTPFETGDRFDPSLQMIPPVAADVEARVRLLHDSDPARAVESVVRGRANRFGRFRGDPIRLDLRGEYRADIVATYRDEDGILWAGARTWAGVVAAQDAPLVAHGMRGADDSPPPRLIWFRRTTPPGSGHIHLPFFSGDVLWATNADAANPNITFADPLGRVEILRERSLPPDYAAPPGFTQRYDDGEARPYIATSTAIDAHIDPSKIDVWGYAYRSIQRPLVRVREIIGEEAVAGYYWRFNGMYGGQRSMGWSGDLANDFKFQFGGIVLRGPALAEPEYAIYGSLFVLVPDDDPNGGSRVFPPFRGNGGGPDGGPLLTLKGRDIEMFLHPTGVVPGTILHRGERISLSGYVAPTVAATVVADLTSPSGKTTRIEGRANKVGWFRASHEPRANESGVWLMKVSVTFEGPNTSGVMTRPFPTGDILGTSDGTYSFYVVDGASPGIELAPVGEVQLSRGPMTLSVVPPAGLEDLKLSHTITMPGFLLRQQTATAMNVEYDPRAFSTDFPNLDVDDPLGRSDTITVSLLLSGVDGDGVRHHFARRVVLEADDAEAPIQSPTTPRRRGVRH